MLQRLELGFERGDSLFKIFNPLGLLFGLVALVHGCVAKLGHCKDAGTVKIGDITGNRLDVKFHEFAQYPLDQQFEAVVGQRAESLDLLAHLQAGKLFFKDIAGKGLHRDGVFVLRQRDVAEAGELAGIAVGGDLPIPLAKSAWLSILAWTRIGEPPIDCFGFGGGVYNRE